MYVVLVCWWSVSVWNKLCNTQATWHRYLLLAGTILQDADEFWNMFILALERLWDADPAVAQFIPQHFRGHMLYQTICKKCTVASQRTEAFYGLSVNIKGFGILPLHASSLSSHVACGSLALLVIFCLQLSVFVVILVSSCVPG